MEAVVVSARFPVAILPQPVPATLTREFAREFARALMYSYGMADWITRFSLEGRTALVTGASKGIGSEICRVFADAGADILATARDEAGLDEVARTVRAKGRRCETMACDLADPDDIARLCQAVLDITTVDILVNNAGVALVEPVLQL